MNSESGPLKRVLLGSLAVALISTALWRLTSDDPGSTPERRPLALEKETPSPETPGAGEDLSSPEAQLEPTTQIRPQPTMGAPVKVHFTPESGTSDCANDVTQQILSQVTAVADGSTISFAPTCYRIDGSLRFDNRNGLTFEGNGATFKASSEGDQARRHFWFFGGGDITIRNLKVVGANPHAGTSSEAYRSDREFQHAFAFQGVDGVLLDNVEAYDVYGDFVYLGPHNGAWTRNVTVRNSHFERNGRQGIAVTAAENVTIENNYIAEVRRATFDLEPAAASWGARNVRIIGNTTGKGRLLWLASGGAGFNVSDIYVANNKMLARTGTPVIKIVPPDNGAASPALTEDLRGPFLIENNSFIVGGSPAAGFDFLRARDVMFRNNQATFPSNRNMTAVQLRHSRVVRVTGNIFKGAAQVLDADPTNIDYAESNNST